MREQKIIVNTKGGLLAALECVRDYHGLTQITLKRKTGKTKYKLHFDNNKHINLAKRKLRKISAHELLS